MNSHSEGVPVASGPIGFTVEPVVPSAPLPGYEMVTEKYAYHPPPSYDQCQIAQPMSFSRPFIPYNPIDLTEDEIRAAVKAHVKSKINYSSSAVSEMVYNKFDRSVAYVYRLKSLLETRKTKYVHEPYYGTPIDGPQNGPAPPSWAIPIRAPDDFIKGKSGAIPVPHTESVRPCFTCHGSGRNRCISCSGVGSKNCSSCSGTGTRLIGGDRQRCSFCSGSGRDRCFSCHGQGSTDCGTCRTRGVLKHWVQIKAHWEVNVEVFISSPVKVKDKDLIKAQGFPILDETGEIVYGLRVGEFVDEAIINFSQTATSKPHGNARVLRQNQSITAVPVTVVEFTRKKETGNFFVYGTDSRVHFDHYPSKNCCIS